MKHTVSLRAISDGLAVPMTLAEVAALIRARGRKCSPGHLSNVERGVSYASARLLATLAAVYGKPREAIENAYRRARLGAS